MLDLHGGRSDADGCSALVAFDGPRKPLRRQSAKARAKNAARKRVREQTARRAGGRCEVADAIPEVACWHPYGEPLDVDERVRRSRRTDAALDVENTRLVCRAHHDWIGLNRVAAAERGLVTFPYWHPRAGETGPESPDS